MTNHKQYPSMDNAQLAQQARPDREAFAELYRRHVLSVFRYHRAHTDNDKDAEDLTSQTFMAALEGMRSYRGTGPYIAWLMGIALRLRARFFRGRRPVVEAGYAPAISSDGKCLAYMNNKQLFLLDMTAISNSVATTPMLLGDLPARRGDPNYQLDKLIWQP
jgi:DNA-directed RNA polymerase specialized sigma24 family protein